MIPCCCASESVSARFATLEPQKIVDFSKKLRTEPCVKCGVGQWVTTRPNPVRRGKSRPLVRVPGGRGAYIMSPGSKRRPRPPLVTAGPRMTIAAAVACVRFSTSLPTKQFGAREMVPLRGLVSEAKSEAEIFLLDQDSNGQALTAPHVAFMLHGATPYRSGRSDPARSEYRRLAPS